MIDFLTLLNPPMTEIDRLLGQAIDLGAVACSRAGATVSPLTGLAVAENTADSLQIGAFLAYFSRGGYTGLANNDLTAAAAWVPSSGKVVVTEPSTGVYRLSFDGTGPVVLSHAIASASDDRFGSFSARLISGTIPASGEYVAFRSGTSAKGTLFALDTLTSERVTYDYSVTSADATDGLAICSGNSSAFVIEIKDMRAHAGTVRMVPMPYQSAASYVTDTDALTFTMPAGVKTIFVATQEYSRVSASAVLLDQSGVSIDTPGSVTVHGSGGSPSIDTSGALSTSAWNSVWVDADGVGTLGAQFNATARATDTEADPIAAAATTLGNNAAEAEPTNSAHIILAWTIDLSAADRAQVLAALSAQLGGFSFVV